MLRSRPLQVFLSCAPEDKRWRSRLEEHLSAYCRSGQIELWHDDRILPGDDRQRVRTDKLKRADVILLLISPKFVASDDCMNVELDGALDRDRAARARVIPLRLRSVVNWHNLPFGRLQPLPRGDRCIADAPDDLLAEVIQELEPLLERGHEPSGPVLSFPIEPPDGGYSPDWYVPRRACEQEVLEHLVAPGQPAVLRGPELFGKSLVFHHVLTGLRSAGTATRLAVINFRSLDNQVWSERTAFFQLLTERLAAVLGPLSDAQRAAVTTSQQLRHLLEQRLETWPDNGRLVLAIDHADAICERPPDGSSLADDFFGFLRAISELGREPDHPLGRLRLLLAVSHSPSFLVKTAHQSLFNFTPDITLSDLSPEETNEMAERHAQALAPADHQALAALVGGHPYLVRLALYRAHLSKCSVASLLAAPHTRVFEHFLRRIRDRLMRTDLYAAARAVSDNEPVSLDSRSYSLLERAGILIRDDNDARPYRLRYPLYRALFHA